MNTIQWIRLNIHWALFSKWQWMIDFSSSLLKVKLTIQNYWWKVYLIDSMMIDWSIDSRKVRQNAVAKHLFRQLNHSSKYIAGITSIAMFAIVLRQYIVSCDRTHQFNYRLDWQRPPSKRDLVCCHHNYQAPTSLSPQRFAVSSLKRVTL